MEDNDSVRAQAGVIDSLRVKLEHRAGLIEDMQASVVMKDEALRFGVMLLTNLLVDEKLPRGGDSEDCLRRLEKALKATPAKEHEVRDCYCGAEFILGNSCDEPKVDGNDPK